MIIKYYNKGWNYIDGISSLRWINKEVNTGILDREGNLDIEKNIEPALGKLTESEYDSETREENIAISVDNLIEEIREHGFSYVKFLIYKKDDFKCILVINQGAYILNENGQTIESIR